MYLHGICPTWHEQNTIQQVQKQQLRSEDTSPWTIWTSISNMYGIEIWNTERSYPK